MSVANYGYSFFSPVSTDIGTVTTLSNANQVTFSMDAPANTQANYGILRNAGNNGYVGLDISGGFIYAIQCEAYIALADGAFTCDQLALGVSSTVGGQVDVGPYSYNNGISQQNVASQTQDSTLYITNSFVYKCTADDNITMFLNARAQSAEMFLSPGENAILTLTVIGVLP